ncbi:54S ribosomal protein L17, mitochondrial [Neolecta irregularis DAH-3]|uniref:Large ribosomal subunit protein mL46 n=1 Tax=Neolecta irregularis (strain DAH-3) TaxID=1198029 RepID=A0A1U7LNH5_NEOID|nr:54S ribosomal protein L17, mitochondrial [Neolecta irregularis DAH-3]|eukprot:OLL24216.1 54S ribosomal protein L17, mitochondrial [Neolecta irregularis DAH-3]
MLSRCQYYRIEHSVSQTVKDLQVSPKRARKAFRRLNQCSNFSTSNKRSNIAVDQLLESADEHLIEPERKGSRYPWGIKAGVILTRVPQIIKLPTPFEKAFYDYQLSLEQRLAARFSANFYFRKGSIAEKRWIQGGYAVLDEKKLLGRRKTKVGEEEKTEMSKDEESVLREDDVVVPNDRITEADRTNDTRSLDRKLDRRLYLLIQKNREENAWRFPQISVANGGVLHTSAEIALHTAVGKNMNTWFVGETPVCHYRYSYPEAKQNRTLLRGARIFFLRAHIFAGQAVPNGSDVKDFMWLTKEEIKEYVAPDYWLGIRHALSDR